VRSLGRSVGSNAGTAFDVYLRVIVFDDVFSGYLPDLAIFNFNTQVPLPIVSFVGLLFGVNVHEPVFDQVCTPGEFDVATADKLLD